MLVFFCSLGLCCLKGVCVARTARIILWRRVCFVWRSWTGDSQIALVFWDLGTEYIVDHRATCRVGCNGFARCKGMTSSVKLIVTTSVCISAKVCLRCRAFARLLTCLSLLLVQFTESRFNLYGLNQEVSTFSRCLGIILDFVSSESDSDEVYRDSYVTLQPLRAATASCTSRIRRC